MPAITRFSFRRPLALLTAGIACFCVSSCIPSANAQNQTLTLDDIYGTSGRLNVSGYLPEVQQWLKDGTHYLEFKTDPASGEDILMKVDALRGTATPFYDAKKMVAAFAALPEIGPEVAQGLAHRESYSMDDSETRALISYRGDFYVYNFQTAQALRLTKSPTLRKSNESFSPDGKRVAFVNESDLYTVDSAVPGVEHRLTRDGSAQIYNGRLDWVYEEEVYGRGKTDGYEWSPNSQQIAFLRIDERPVKPFEIVDHLPRLQNIEVRQYPKAGDPNPIVTLGVADANGTAPVRFVDTTKYPDNDRLVVRFSWSPDSARVVYQIQNRVQTFLDLNSADAKTGKLVKTLIHETTPAWVEIIGNPVYLKDGSFLWFSDRTGYRHLYHYSVNGTAIGAVTKGDWDIRTIEGVDEADGWLYFASNKDGVPNANAYRTRLDGSTSAVPTRLTAKDGTHSTRFDPTFHYYLDEWSDIHTPTQLWLCEAATGKTVRVLGDNPEPLKNLAEFKLSKPELLQVKTRDGFMMDAMIIRPPDFDPTKKYPVFCPVYGGPAIQNVHNDWGGRGELWYQLLAQKGYIVWMCDNRSASAKGMKSVWPIFHKMGESELNDIEDGISYLKSQSYVDGSRIGISGWSYGGFMAEYALTHSKSFKMGIAGAGVSDWHFYDSIYTERYMGTPEANAAGYTATSPVVAARACSGKLLIIHGMMDDNVHLQNSVAMVYALEKAGKDFEMMFYPSPRSRHGIGDLQLNRHLQETMTKFILENL